MRLGALFAFVVGCAQPAPPPDRSAPAAPLPPAPVIRVHVDVSRAMAPDVLEGIRSWERATRGWRRWELAGPATAHAHIVEIDPNTSGAPCQVPGYAIAGCSESIGGLDDEDDPRASIWLFTGHYEAAPQWVTMHEIGHALGLTHMDGTLMQGGKRSELVTLDCPDEVTLMRMYWRTGHPFTCR